jgi:hypothetical protein
MFKGQAFGQPPFVLGSAIGGIDTEPVMQNPALCLEIRGSDEFHHPSRFSTSLLRASLKSLVLRLARSRERP